MNVVYGHSNVPLLGFAIINSENLQADTSLMVATLLGLGEKATVIPNAFYTPFCQDLTDDGPLEEEMDDLNEDSNDGATKRIVRGLPELST